MRLRLHKSACVGNQDAAIYISLVSGRLYQYLASEATLDCPESARNGRSNSFAYWLFHAITFERKFFENPRA